MRWIPSLICLLVVLHGSYAPPVSPDKSQEESDVKDNLVCASLILFVVMKYVILRSGKDLNSQSTASSIMLDLRV